MSDCKKSDHFIWSQCSIWGLSLNEFLFVLASLRWLIYSKDWTHIQIWAKADAASDSIIGIVKWNLGFIWGVVYVCVCVLVGLGYCVNIWEMRTSTWVKNKSWGLADPILKHKNLKMSLVSALVSHFYMEDYFWTSPSLGFGKASVESKHYFLFT